ncbi:hypothetical protein EST38_g10004 [Candolleomyces aberdarensis]|uniref:Uncharacterized protein n=1 Tax=Candolleomyces aberdarensis TaxID=2316362 RepID=A0A4V1Q2P9_9AGAR|nr:hypothetical protein EST38_g10004 [Candolleomyces aberdarensis]
MQIPKTAYDFERKIPIPQPKVWSTWQLLQSKIVHAVHLLLFVSGAAAVRPAYPCARIDRKVESGKIGKAELKKDIFTAFSWFSIWFGCLAYAIAVNEVMTQEAQNLNIRRIPKWIEILLVDGRKDLDSQQDGVGVANPRELTLDETFVSDLANSCVGRFDGSVERVGAFVTIPADDKEDAVSIDWLVACHVPVWYAWGQREEEIARKNPYWQRYAPPPDAVQVTSWGSDYEGRQSSSASAALAQADTSALDNAPASSRPSKHYPVQRELELHERTWEVFFKQRALIRADVLAKETPQDRARREDRERRPPTSTRKTRFFEWERDEQGVFVRQKVEGEDWEDLFDDEGRYGIRQAKYDSVFNEWDLPKQTQNFMGAPYPSPFCDCGFIGA